MTGDITNFIHTCTIQKKTVGSSDHHGGGANTWADDQTSVPCRFTNLTEQKRYPEPRGIVVSDIPVCILPETVTVTPLTYRIVTTQSGFSGTYEIIRVQNRPTAYGTNQITAHLQVV
ncbi:MAG: hypothetical protein M0Q91_07695 [Methanoregula sp.]|jgi:hypothetical protein|nr:hypothetical protein [Methanoregula sp.]